MKDQYDITFLGAGISAAYTLIHLVANLEKQPRIRPVRIAAIEQTGEFWSGVPYGKKSGRNPLIITSIKEFIPQQPERDHFIDWLKQNYDRLFNIPEQREGRLTAKWQKAHKEAIAKGQWDDLFVPRYVFGVYIEEHVKMITDAALAAGFIHLDLITGTVHDVEKMGEGFTVRFTAGSGSETLFSEKIILGIGSPPNLDFGKAYGQEAHSHCAYISNIYEPSLDESIDKACTALSQRPPGARQVLIVGSNAGTLDILFALNNSPKAAPLIEKFQVLSPNAAFPHRISKEFVDPGFVATHLVKLASKHSYTAKEILEAVVQDVAAANAGKLNIADIFPEVSRAMIEALDRLSIEEQKLFVSRYALEIGKMQRRAGGEYLDVVDDLVAAGRFEFIKGRFVSYLSPDEHGPGVQYTDGVTRELKILNESIGLVINCAGFQEVATSSSELIQNLIRRKIALPNDSNRGFVLNERFETSPDCYLMGPLVAGNLNASFRVWHAESCSRIIHMSKKLADVLAN